MFEPLARLVGNYLSDWFTVKGGGESPLFVLFLLPFESPHVYVDPDGDDTWLVTDYSTAWSDLFCRGFTLKERAERIARKIADRFQVRFWNEEFRVEKCTHGDLGKAVIRVFLASVSFQLAMEIMGKE